MANNNAAPEGRAPEGRANDRVADRAPEVQTRGDLNLVDQTAGSANSNKPDVNQQRSAADQYMQSHNFASASDLLGPNGQFAGAAGAGAGTDRQATLNPQDYGGRNQNPSVPGDQQKSPYDQQKPPGDAGDLKGKEKSPYDPGTPEEIRARMPATQAAVDGKGGWTPEATKEWNKEFGNAVEAPGADQGTIVSRMGKVADAFGKNPDGSEKVSVATRMDSSQTETEVSVMVNHNQREANQNMLSQQTHGERPPAQPHSIIKTDIRNGTTPKG
jgi:hypothetical protein